MEALVADPAASRTGSTAREPAVGGNKAAKLKAIREALRTAKRVWLATDCDREGQLIGQEILEHYNYRGEVMRVLFTAQDSQTIRDAFGDAKPNSEYARLYAAAVARRQADQIYNLSLTRTATVILGRGARGVIGVGRVKTPTLAIVCKRELEIRNFVPVSLFRDGRHGEGRGRRSSRCGMRRQERILKREMAEAVVNAAAEASRARSACASRTSGRGRPSCTTCRRCRSSALRASAGRPPRRWRSRRSSMMARARRSSPIPAPRCATCRRA